MTSAVIETELTAFRPAAAPGLDPLSAALRERGYRSISVGLRTVQVDGALYDLCSEGQAAVASWLQGEHWPRNGKIHLVRHTIQGQ